MPENKGKRKILRVKKTVKKTLKKWEKSVDNPEKIC